MTHTNDGQNNLNSNDNINSSLESSQENLKSGETVMVQGTEFTKEEIERANQPQPNVILSKAGDGNPHAGESYRDPERINTRSNEASDSTDTNTGQIIAGAAKGTAQS